MTTITSVEAYIKNAHEVAQPILKSIRTIITTTIPEAEERIAWNVPNYRLNGVITGFAVYSKHVSLGFSEGGLSKEEKSMFESKGYKTGKGTVQIKFDQQVPADEIKLTLLRHAKLNTEKK